MLASDLDALVRAAQAERLPSVAAAVVRKGEPVWAGAVGLADAEAGAEASPETQYRIGSITKTFAAVAILQLAEAGALDLDDPLERHLPEAAHGTPTLRRMLAHVSGLQREPPGEVWESLESPDEEELVRRVADAELVLPPHTAHHYSNLAFALLGVVVARRSGLAYRAYVDERILRPLGLARTTWEPAPPFAQGYFVEPYADVLRREAHVDLRGVEAAGQLWSTVGDLCRWATFLAAGDDAVLPAARVAAMWWPHGFYDPDRWTLAWGLGLMLYREGDRILGGHGGAMPGHLAGVAIDRTTQIGAAVLTNSSAGADPEGLARRLALKAIEELPETPTVWRPAAGPPPELASMLGRWWSEGGEHVFSWRDGHLEARLAAPKRPPQPSVFEPLGGDVFRTASGREQGELLRLVRDDAGRVVRMYWATYPFTREPEVFQSDEARRPA